MTRRWIPTALAALALGLALALGPAIGGTVVRAAPAPAELVGDWELVTLQVAGQPAEDTTGVGLTLTFRADGQIVGSGGCNGFGGMVTTDDRGRLQIAQFVATLRACVDTAANAREQRYFAALQEARGYTLEGTTTLRFGFDQPGR
jgi:putative lipoprotein